MDYTRLIKRIGLLFIGQIVLLSPQHLSAQEDSVITDMADDTVVIEEVTEVDDAVAEETEDEAVEKAVPLVSDKENGKALFQGAEPFYNGGPSCVTCHNVSHEGVIPGGLFAKDLTDVYTRYGEGLSSWLGAPSFPAMATSYNNNPLTEQERVDLSAFLKYVDETKGSQEARSGFEYFFIGGGIGLICLLGLIQLLWNNRKKKMVKADIFARQNKAWDAKF